MEDNYSLKVHKGSLRIALFVFFASILLSVILAFWLTLMPQSTSGTKSDNFVLKQFESNASYEAYFADTAQSRGGFGGIAFDTVAQESAIPNPQAPSNESSLKASPERFSDTNVQVAGIDEPDIVKTNGDNIFYSPQGYYYPLERTIAMPEDTLLPPPARVETKIIKAFPATELSETGSVAETGNLLLTESNLIVFSGNVIKAYDVEDPINPEASWTLKIDSNQQIFETRLYEGNIYVILKKYAYENPCPIPLAEGISPIVCTDIYYPPLYNAADSVFTVMKIDSKNGNLSEKTSFVGSSSTSVVYISKNSIYITYTYTKSQFEIYSDFFKSQGTGILDSETMAKLTYLQNLDISDQAKNLEFQLILEKFYNKKGNEERRNIQNKIQTKMEAYLNENARQLEKTGIVKLSVNDLSTKATQEIAGRPLNQFSLDEYQGDLRVATTVGGRTLGNTSENDVYILDENMKEVSSIKGLGLDERVYSARFLQDKGYLVTFKETDPFFVLDLKDTKKPKVVGELKIPGFSSYLHPLKENLILGVGREGNGVKLSLFDVADPANPQEADKYSLEEYWSQVQNNHHAFLQDTKHSVFFLPAGTAGFVFSYERGSFDLVKSIEGIQAERALFINDNLYVIGQNSIEVYDENNWNLVNSLSLN